MIYAINKQTKEHHVLKNGSSHDAGKEVEGRPSGHIWRMIQADADGWIPWNGGECPLPDEVRFDAMFRDGDSTNNNSPKFWRWSHYGVPIDIIAYRPISILNEQQELTMHPTDKLAAARKALEAAQKQYDEALAEHQADYPWLHGDDKPARDLPPEEWRVGDVVEWVSHGPLGCTKGTSYRIVGFKWVKASLKIIVVDDQNDRIGYRASAFRFHSRP